MQCKTDDEYRRRLHIAHGLFDRYKVPDHSAPMVVMKIEGDIRNNRYYKLHDTIYILKNPWTGIVAVGIQNGLPVTALGMYMRYNTTGERGKTMDKLYKTALSHPDLPEDIRERLENYDEVTLNELNNTTTSTNFDVLWEQGIYKAYSKPDHTTEQVI